MKENSFMMEREKIAHDLALLYVQNVIDEKIPSITGTKKIVDEYIAAYQSIFEKLETSEKQ